VNILVDSSASITTLLGGALGVRCVMPGTTNTSCNAAAAISMFAKTAAVIVSKNGGLRMRHDGCVQSKPALFSFRLQVAHAPDL
jgi:hypothetical protein